MSRRRSIKRNLPALEVTTFTSSGHSKRKLELTTPVADETSSSNDRVNNSTHLGPLAVPLCCPDEIDSDVEDCVDEQEESSYAKKQRKAAQNWSEIRSCMLRAVVESECVPHGAVCSECAQEPATFRCLKCGIGVFYCETCVAAVHENRNFFHVIEEWKDGMFLPSRIDGTVLNPRPLHLCQTTEIKTITVISESWFRHQLRIVTCKCEPFPVTLARLRMWPTSSKQPCYALCFDLLDLMEAMLLECQVSLHDFCKALNNKLPKYVMRKNIYPLIIDCFEEYRHLKHELRTLTMICPEKDYGNICPACPVNDGVLVESFDALFGLPRKKSAGSSVRPPLHGNNVFYSQEDVDEFMKSYPTSEKSLQKECSDFKAGDVLRSSTQYRALDETAVFGRACRHGFPKKFLNLKHGERIGYAVWVLRNMVCDNEGKNIRMKIMYDVACILFKHLQASGQMSYLEQVDLAVPAFHIYGHRGYCQLQYSPRRVAGFALSDGEQLERMWSYLRRFGRMTKEMRPSHRSDVLSDAILHYGRKCKDSLVSWLINNWKKATQCISASTESISELMSKSPVPLTELIIDKLAETERRLVGCGTATENAEAGNSMSRVGATNFPPNTQTIANWVPVYMGKLKIYYSLRCTLSAEGSLQQDAIPEVVKKITRLDKDLKEIERHNGVSARWTTNDDQYKNQLEMEILKKCKELHEKIKPAYQERIFLLKLKEKYSDGHALSKKLEKQIKKCNKKLKQMLAEYTVSRELLKEETKCSIQALSIDLFQKEELQETVFENQACNAPEMSIPHSIRRQAIDMQHLLRRSKEEKQMVEDEMERVLQYHQNDEKNVSNKLNELSQIDSDMQNKYTVGSISLLKSEQKILQQQILSIQKSFIPYISLPALNLPCTESNELEDDDAASIESRDDTSTDESDEEIIEF